MSLFADRLKIANILTRGNVPRESAEAFADAIAETIEPAVTDREVEARVETRMAQELEPIRAKLEFDEVTNDQKFQAMLARSDARFAEMQAQMDTRFTEMQAQMDTRFAEMNVRFAELLAEIQSNRAENHALHAETNARMAQMEVHIYRAVGFATALILAAMSAWAAFG